MRYVNNRHSFCKLLPVLSIKLLTMDRKRFLIISSGIIVLIIAFFLITSSKEDLVAITTKALRGPFEILVYSTGQLESENSDNILVPEQMKDTRTRISYLTITDLVEEGTLVDSGDYVATLDYQTVEEQLNLAMDDLERTLTEYEDSKIDSNLTLSNQRDQIVNAQLDVEEKEITVHESTYDSPSIRRKAEMDLDKAQRKLNQVKDAYQLVMQQESNKVARKYISYKQVHERVDAINDLKDNLIIRSPRAGVVSYYQYPYGSSVQTGTRVSQWNPIIATFPDMNSLITKTFINEIDVALIKQEQKVKIGIDAFPDKELEGEVVSVANMGQLMPQSDAKVFEVKIKVNGSDPELKPAMTTSNIIQTGYFEDVVYVPIESVFSNDSLSFVYLAGNDKIKQIIETGEENENFVIVNQGISEGEELYLSVPADADDFKLSGFEIYADILRKKELEKTKKEPKNLQTGQSSNQNIPVAIQNPGTGS